jgi:calmodulin
MCIEFIAMMTGRTREPKPAPAATEPAEPKPISDPEAAPIPVASELADPEEEWKAAWKEFDHSLNGSITAAQLRQVVANLGETISDVEVDGMMKSVDAEDKIICRSS